MMSTSNHSPSRHHSNHSSGLSGPRFIRAGDLLQEVLLEHPETGEALALSIETNDLRSPIHQRILLRSLSNLYNLVPEWNVLRIENGGGYVWLYDDARGHGSRGAWCTSAVRDCAGARLTPGRVRQDMRTLRLPSGARIHILSELRHAAQDRKLPGLRAAG